MLSTKVEFAVHRLRWFWCLLCETGKFWPAKNKGIVTLGVSAALATLGNGEQAVCEISRGIGATADLPKQSGSDGIAGFLDLVEPDEVVRHFPNSKAIITAGLQFLGSSAGLSRRTFPPRA